jgi:Cu/Ag efflux protein CusF
MRIRSVLAAAAAIVLFPLAVSAQQAAVTDGLVAVGPGKLAGVMEVQATLVVEAIDKASRAITLGNQQGEKTKVIAGDEIKNFDQIKIGDQVVAKYTQELVMTLKKGGGELRERIDSSQQGSAPLGEKPSAYAAKEVAFIADVQEVNRKQQTVTLRGATRTVRLKIKDPEQLKLIQKGDQVEGVYAEADRRRSAAGHRQGEEINQESIPCTAPAFGSILGIDAGRHNA